MAHTVSGRIVLVSLMTLTFCIARPGAIPAQPAPSSASENAVAMLDMLLTHDALFTGALEKLYARNVIARPPEAFKQTVMESLAAIAASDMPEIAPGCLLPYTIAATALLTYTPTTFVLFLNELSNGDDECALMYGSWSIAGICFALASWTQYRICAEQNAEAPDQTTLARLQDDLLTMEIGAIAAAGSGLVFRTGCSSSFFKLTGLNRRKKR